jgi:chromosome segregation ATPase
VVRAYDALLRIHDDAAAEAELDAVREELDRADDTYGRALAGMGFRVDEAVARLRTVEDEASARLRALEVSLAEASAARDAFSREAERLGAMLARQQEAKAVLEETVGRLEAEISSLGAQRREYQARIEEIHACTSWRLTAPVRSAGALLRRLRGGDH